MSYGYGAVSYGTVAYGSGAPGTTSGSSTQTVTPAGIATAENFGQPTRSVGAVTRTPAGTATAENFGQPAVANAAGPQTVTPAGTATAEHFGTPIVVGLQVVYARSVPTAEQHGEPTVRQPFPQTITLAGQGIAPTATAGVPLVLPVPAPVVVDGIVRWQLSDPATGESYVFPLNPKQGGAAAELPYKRSSSSSHDAFTPIVIQTQDEPGTSSFEGQILTRAMFEAMWEWARKDRTLVLRDDLGRVEQIYITDFQPKRIRKRTVPYYHEYTVRYLILQGSEA